MFEDANALANSDAALPQPSFPYGERDAGVRYEFGNNYMLRN